MTQLSFLDQPVPTGLDRVECNNAAFIRQMRHIARAIAKEYGSVSTDELRRYAADNDIEAPHMRVWGAVLKGKEWAWIGRKKSEWPSNNSRMINVYTVRVK